VTLFLEMKNAIGGEVSKRKDGRKHPLGAVDIHVDQRHLSSMRTRTRSIDAGRIGSSVAVWTREIGRS
jgi:hypothetical protein